MSAVPQLGRQSHDYRSFRRQVLERDGYRCVGCGTPEHLEVHHVFPYARFPHLRTNPAYAVTACEECHATIDPSRAAFVAQRHPGRKPISAFAEYQRGKVRHERLRVRIWRLLLLCVYIPVGWGLGWWALQAVTTMPALPLRSALEHSWLLAGGSPDGFAVAWMWGCAITVATGLAVLWQWGSRHRR